MKHKDIIDKMTIEEKAALLSGKGEWQTWDFERLGIPSIFCSDGPHGIRKQAGAGDHLGLNPSLPATCFPTAATMANSWDPVLGEEIGRALGEEAAVQGVDIVLGPGLNIKRSPLCGRNFEYFSEDPYLAGKMAAGYVRGIQSSGRYACPKHFAVNSQELRRMAIYTFTQRDTERGMGIQRHRDHGLGRLQRPYQGRGSRFGSGNAYAGHGFCAAACESNAGWKAFRRGGRRLRGPDAGSSDGADKTR